MDIMDIMDIMNPEAITYTAVKMGDFPLSSVPHCIEIHSLEGVTV